VNEICCEDENGSFSARRTGVSALSGTGTPAKIELLAHVRLFCDFFVFRRIN